MSFSKPLFPTFGGGGGGGGATGPTGPTGAEGTPYWTLYGSTALAPTSTSYYVGIGKTVPAAALDVEGSIFSSKDELINGKTIGIGPGNDSSNLVFGSDCFTNNLSGIGNIIIGTSNAQAMTESQNNLILGFRNYTSCKGDNNTLIGNGNLGSSIFTAVSNNIAVGNYNLSKITSGTFNIAFGIACGTETTIGLNNLFFGNNAGVVNTTGSNNTYIGNSADCGSNALNNSTAIGNGAQVNADDQVRIGNASVTDIGGQVGWNTVSDARDKTNFVPIDAGLNFINELNPIRFDWNQRGGGLEGRKDVGFTAQDLLLVQEKTKIPIPNLVNESNPDKYSVMYTQLIPILVKSVQEMSSTINRLEAEINELKSTKQNI